MGLVAQCLLLSSLLVTALCLSCENDSNDCDGKITCNSGQKPECSKEQCFCRTGAQCVPDGNCSEMCTSAETYDCRQFRCYCSGL